MENNQNILTIIESSFDSMTDLEKRIANYFLNPNSVYDDLSSLQVTHTLHISQAALTRFAKKCGFKGYREFNFQYLHLNCTNFSCKKYICSIDKTHEWEMNKNKSTWPLPERRDLKRLPE